MDNMHFETNTNDDWMNPMLTSLNELYDVLGEDTVEIVDMFLVDAEQRLIAMRQILEQEDFQTLSKEAHSLKGSCRNLGVEAMAKPCEILEQKEVKISTQEAITTFIQLENAFKQVQPLLLAEREKFRSALCAA